VLTPTSSYAGIFSVSGTDMAIEGIINIKMPADTIYTIRLGGVRNPRYVITDAETDTN